MVTLGDAERCKNMAVLLFIITPVSTALSIKPYPLEVRVDGMRYY